MEQSDESPRVRHTSAATAGLYRALSSLLYMSSGTEIGDHIERTLEEYRESQADEELIARAKELYQNDDCEVDTGALTSEADDGIWVQAWVWVPNKDTESDN